MSRKLIVSIAALLLIMALLVACGGGTTDPATDTPEDTPADVTTDGEETEPEPEPVEEEEGAEEPAASDITELNILWAQWDPADYLQEIGNMYEEETGSAVNIIQEPWGSFQDLFFTEMAAQGTSYDMVVGDSQWLGQAST